MTTTGREPYRYARSGAGAGVASAARDLDEERPG